MNPQIVPLWLWMALTLISGTINTFSQTVSWQQTNLKNIYITTLAIDSSGSIFAGTYDKGIYRSRDNGDSWSQVGTGLESSYIRTITINSLGYVFAGTSGAGVFLSTDHGDHWTQINNGLADSIVEALMIASDGSVFAGIGAKGIFRSTDNGNSWTLTNNGNPSSITAFAQNSMNGDIFAMSYSTGVYRSTGNGSSWTQTSFRHSYGTSLAINSSGIIFAGDAGGVRRSTDNGNNWEQSSPPQSIRSLTINSEGYVFAGGFNGVIHTIDDGNSWIQDTSGLTDTNVQTLAINDDGYIFAGTLLGGAFRSVHSTTGVNDLNDNIPKSFRLYQNYPNPFNAQTTISYFLPIDTYVTLKVLDVLGRIVSTIIDEPQGAGYKSVRFYASKLPSGIYFYKLSAGNFNNVKKMLLLK